MTLSWFDAAGLVGAALMLAGYALTVGGRLAATGAAALTLNLVGATLVLVSLSRDFNLSAAVIEGAWAAIAAIGLIRLALARAPRG